MSLNIPSGIGKWHPLPGPDLPHSQFGPHLLVARVFVFWTFIVINKVESVNVKTCRYDGTWQLLVFAVEKIVQFPVHSLRSGESPSGLLYGSET